MSLPFNATAHVMTDGQQIIDAVERTGLDAPVPSCDGWTMGDLAWHVAEVWNFWGHIVRDGVTDVEGVKRYTPPPRPNDDMLLMFVATARIALHGSLIDTPPDTEVWTWTGQNRDVLWVRRRMAHETAVHRWDAERTVGDPYRIPIAMAADGIDEFLAHFSWRSREQALPGTVHIHCTDTDRDVATGSDDIGAVSGEWMIHELDGSGVRFDRTHQKGDAAIRGRASDVLLWLWGRDAGPVEILGDESVADHLRTGSMVG